MSSAFDNGTPNLQSSDSTRNKAQKTIFNNLRREVQNAKPKESLKYQLVRVCVNDGCLVSTPSYQSKMDVNFGWLLCETPWCAFDPTNPANNAAVADYLEMDTSDIAQTVVDTDAAGGDFPSVLPIPPYDYNTYPNSSKIIMNLGSTTLQPYSTIYEPADLHIDPDGRLFSGQQMITDSTTTTNQNVRYCAQNSSLWKNYITTRDNLYVTPLLSTHDTSPYKLLAAQHTSRVPSNITYGTKYSILRKNGSKKKVPPTPGGCPCDLS